MTARPVAEAVRQVRGTSVNQVPGDGPVLVTAGTGVSTSALILALPAMSSGVAVTRASPGTHPSLGQHPCHLSLDPQSHPSRQEKIGCC
jgi:hypothetical protein